MRMGDVLSLSFQALRSKKLRTSLTILGILIGPAIVVGLTGLTLGFSNLIYHNLFSSTSPNDVFVTSGNSKLNAYVIQEIQQLEGVKEVVPYYLIPATIQTPSGPTGTEILSIDMSKAQAAFPGLTLQTGQYPSPYSAFGAVVGYYIAHPQYPLQPTYQTGQTIQVVMNTPEGKVTKTFLVTGNFNEFSSAFADVDQSLIVQSIVGRQYYGDQYSGAIVVVDSVSQVNQVASEIQNTLGNGVRVVSVEQFVTLINQTTASIDGLLFVAGASSFIVAFVGILSTMFTTVMERIREIGVLRAIGFTRRSIMILLMAESIMMGLIGGIAGVGAGVGMGYLLTSLSNSGGVRFGGGGPGGANSFGGGGPGGANPFGGHVTPVFEPVFMLEVIGITAVFSLLAGIIPAYRASRIEPAVALRYEV